MKILFIIPSVFTMAGLNYIPTFPHLGIAYLAGMARRNHEVKIIDMRLKKDLNFLRKLIKSYEPELIGITLTSVQHRSVYELILNLRDGGDYKIILGGPHVSALKKKTLEESSADLAITGEGEYTLEDICSGKPYKDIDGLIWRNNGDLVENKKREYIFYLDNLPFPAFELFDLDNYVDRKIPILSSRGCPYNCIFCSVALSMGRIFRPRTPENVVAEIEYWHGRGFRWFQFQDDCFSFDMEREKKNLPAYYSQES